MVDFMNFENYSCDNQMSIFDFTREPISITKPIRLIELFAGYGSQAMALKRIGAKFEHYRVVEFDKYAIASYNAVHGTNFPTMDITKVHAGDLNICDTETFTYLLTYLLTRFHAPIYRLPESKPECLREVVQEAVCCGKLREY